MRFMMLVIPKDYANAEPDAMPDPGMVETMEKYNNQLRQAGALISLDGLRPPSAGARIEFSHGTATVSRGPFTGARETLGGFWMIRAKSLDEAVDWASRAPMADRDIIEVRQVQETEDFPAEVRKVLAASAPKPAPRSAARA
jgi:hypothetical protein